jgi:alpha-ketoglutarate-dependent taurine dioxygenase
MIAEELATKVRVQGWVHMSAPPDIDVGMLVRRLGRIMPSRLGSQEHDVLRPYSETAAPRKSMSAVTGTEAQPMHTDGAYYPRPPRFLLFRCVEPGEAECNTLIWTLDFNLLLKERPPALIQRGWVVRGGGIPPFYCRVFNWNSYGENFIRFDPCCMLPPDRDERAAQAVRARLEAYAHLHVVTWRRGDLLLVNNWRCLHARGDGAARAPARRLDRWMIGE